MLLASPAWGAITFVTADASAGSGASFISIAGSQVAGNTGVVCVSIVDTTQTATVTDAGGSIWTRQTSVNNSTTIRSEVWTTPSMVASADTVTVSISGGGGHASGVFLYYSGVAAIGTNNTATGNSTTPGLAITTQDANNYIIGCGAVTNGSSITWSAGTGNLRESYNCSSTPIACVAGVDNTAASASSVTVTATQDTSRVWAATGVELRSVTGATRRPMPPIIFW